MRRPEQCRDGAGSSAAGRHSLRAAKVAPRHPAPYAPLRNVIGNGEIQSLFAAGGIQAKLRVSQPGDPDEIEADRIAQSVGNDSPVQTNFVASVGQTVHRKCACSGGTKCPGCKDEESGGHIQRKSSPGARSLRSAPNGALASLGPGRALDAGTRGHMESRLGQDFGAVRIHDDARADESAKSIEARAFTYGHDVAFASGEYAPHSAEGRRLLAHELVHVVQQRSSIDRTNTIQRQPADSLRANLEGVPREKYSPQLEVEYRKRGNFKTANAIKRCRENGGAYCDMLLTTKEVALLYKYNISDPEFIHKLMAKRSSGRSPGQTKTSASHRQSPVPAAGVAIGGLAVVPSATALEVTGGAGLAAAPEAALAAGSSTSIPAAGLAEGSMTDLLAGEGGLGVAEGITVSASTIATAGVTFAAIVAVQLSLMAAFQDVLKAEGFTLLDDPLGVCIGGCHYPTPSGPPEFHDFPEPRTLPRRFPMRPEPFSPQVPRRDLEPFHPVPPSSPTQPAKPKPRQQEPQKKEHKEPRVEPKERPDPRKRDKKKCRDAFPCEMPLPILWPKDLPLPVDGLTLVRTPSKDADFVADRRSRIQEIVQGSIKRAQQQNVPIPVPCFSHERDPQDKYEAHHMHPLFLGGREDSVNVCALKKSRHAAGHPALNNQSRMFAADAIWEACKVCSPFLTKHPGGQDYEIEQSPFAKEDL